MNKCMFFFIGTEAELIKLFPVIYECKNRKISYKVIASGQNDILNSRIWREIGGAVDLELTRDTHITKMVQLAWWWLRTYSVAKRKILKRFANIDLKHSTMIVHGDTVSTFMGALLGWQLGMRTCHVEAGLRSHNIFNPFPEELDRLLTSVFARVHFAPGKAAAANLKHVKGRVIDTECNTLVDSLRLAEKVPVESNLSYIEGGNYFVFVMHRQENLLRRDFVEDVVNRVIKVAKEKRCIMILHEITQRAFVRFGIMDELRKNSNIVLQSRVDYFDFMKVLKAADFVITDGGSNQEELYYMGKPCLILRKHTERDEGLGKNAVLFEQKLAAIEKFASLYDRKHLQPFVTKISPAKIIVDILQENQV